MPLMWLQAYILSTSIFWSGRKCLNFVIKIGVLRNSEKFKKVILAIKKRRKNTLGAASQVRSASKCDKLFFIKNPTHKCHQNLSVACEIISCWTTGRYMSVKAQCPSVEAIRQQDEVSTPHVLVWMETSRAALKELWPTAEHLLVLSDTHSAGTHEAPSFPALLPIFCLEL